MRFIANKHFSKGISWPQQYTSNDEKCIDMLIVHIEDRAKKIYNVTFKMKKPINLSATRPTPPQYIEGKEGKH